MAVGAIEDMKVPDMNKPHRPVAKKEGVDRDSDDPMFKIEYEEYIRDMKIFRQQRGNWEENQPQTYNLILQHCPPELETRLITQLK